MSERMQSGKESKRAVLKSLADMVYWKLRDDIAARVYDDTGRLPSEVHLAAKYQVSRPVIGQVLSRLRNEKVIVSKRGSGSFLLKFQRRKTNNFGSLKVVADFQRCYEFRISFEPTCAMFAAERADDEALKEIIDVHERIKASMLIGQYVGKEDFNFHMAIARAANNHYFTDLLWALSDHIDSCVQIGTKFLDGPETRLPQLVDEHEAILASIRARDSDGAHVNMRLHISKSLERMFGSHTLELSLDAKPPR